MKYKNGSDVLNVYDTLEQNGQPSFLDKISVISFNVVFFSILPSVNYKLILFSASGETLPNPKGCPLLAVLNGLFLLPIYWMRIQLLHLWCSGGLLLA